MRRIIIPAFGLLAAACSSQLAYDLGKAAHECHARTWPGKAALVECLGARERPVWAKGEPSTLDLYDGFAAAREDLARQFDQGALDQTQYRDRLAELSLDFRAQITERRQSMPPPP